MIFEKNYDYFKYYYYLCHYYYHYDYHYDNLYYLNYIIILIICYMYYYHYHYDYHQYTYIKKFFIRHKKFGIKYILHVLFLPEWGDVSPYPPWIRE